MKICLADEFNSVNRSVVAKPQKPALKITWLWFLGRFILIDITQWRNCIDFFISSHSFLETSSVIITGLKTRWKSPEIILVNHLSDLVSSDDNQLNILKNALDIFNDLSCFHFR